MTRRALVLLAVAVWLGAMAWLVRREYLTPATDIMLDAGLVIPPGATFFTVSLGDRQVGTASMTTDTLPDGIRVVTRFDLDLPGPDGSHHLVTTTEAVYGRSLHLRTFTRRVAGSVPPAVIAGTVAGDSLLTMRVGAPEAPPNQVIRQRLTGPVILPSAVPLRAALEGKLRTGQEIASEVVDPATLSLRTAVGRVVADSVLVVPDSADLDTAGGLWRAATWDTVPVVRIDRSHLGLPVVTWIDPSGYLVRATTPLGFTLTRTAFELASENYRRAGRDSALAPDDTWPAADLTRAPSGQRRIDRMTTVLDGGPAAGDGAAWEALAVTTPWQALRGDTIHTSVKPEFDTVPVLVMDYRLPYPDRDAWDLLEDGAYDGADPRVAAQAHRIITGEDRVMAAADRLARWVAEEIELAPAAEPAGAWRVLQQKRGDASGKTALFVALCRAAGIPARPVAGFVYRAGRFHYHVWAEVWLTEWVGADPALRQSFADASHIRLVTGAVAYTGSLPALIGRLRPRLVEFELAP